MTNISFDLPEMLELLSYQMIVTAIAFGIVGGFLHASTSPVATAFDATAGVLIVFGMLFNKLSNHED